MSRLRTLSRAAALLIGFSVAATACGSSAPATLSSAAPSAPSGSSAAKPASSGASATLQSIIDGANKEGQITLWADYPTQQDLPKVQQALNAKFGTNLKLVVSNMAAGDARTRITADAQAGRNDVDVISQLSTDMIPDLAQKNLIATVDWMGIFGSQLPDIKDAYDGAFPEFRGKYLEFADRTYTLIYNTKQMSKSDLPKHWADLADAKYRGKVAYDARGFPFNYLFLNSDWGEDKTLSLVKAIAANQPLLQGGAPQIGQAVSRGEAPMGIGAVGTTLAAKEKGEPMDIAFMDYLPQDPFVSIVAEKAPHPNAARLYLAWAVTEGLKLYYDMYKFYRTTQPGNPLDTAVKEQSPGIKIASSKNVADVTKSADMLKKSGGILSGTG
jgi:ABC-type Fe3+ transport system substrate-binding protein